MRTAAITPSDRRQMASRLEIGLPASMLEKMRGVAEVADRMGAPAFLVGGFVRDLLLGVENVDLDVLIQGDGAQAARKAAAKLGGEAAVHDKFHTAVVQFDDGIKMDVASARTEFYRRPGALPDVAHSSVMQDLYRRDFTINTLAVQLNSDNFGALMDYYGGVKDLEDGIIRVLHNLSFIDDPTRIFRAVRFEQRFGFRIEENTLKLISDAVSLDLFRNISWERIRDEIILILKEKNPVPAVKRLMELDIVKALDPSLKPDLSLLDPGDKVALVESDPALKDRLPEHETWLVYFLCLIRGLGPSRGRELATHLRFRKQWITCVVQLLRELDVILAEIFSTPNLSPSRVYHLLESLEPEVLILAMAASRENSGAASAIGRFIAEYRDVELEIGGEDLIRRGFKPDRMFGEVLARVFDEKLDGGVSGRGAELARAVELLENLGIKKDEK